jgi:CRP/FNR family transcriptional regulator, cyclic AMP receptor protein
MPTQTPELVDALRRVPLLSEVSGRDLERLARGLTERTFPPGTVIVQQGKSGAGFWILLAGSASVEIDGDQKNTLGPGDWLGEIALIDDGPRSATIVADTDLRCLGITPWEFRPFVREHPDVAWTLLATMARRLRDAEARPA